MENHVFTANIWVQLPRASEKFVDQFSTAWSKKMVRADDHAAERTESASGLFRWTNYESRGKGSFFLPSYLPNLSKILQEQMLMDSKKFREIQQIFHRN